MNTETAHSPSFDEVYTRWKGPITRFFLRRTGMDMADDLTADVFLLLWQRFEPGRFPGQQAAGRYLFVGARYILAKYYQRRSTRQWRVTNPLERLDGTLYDVADPDPAEHVEAWDARLDAEALLQALPPHFARALWTTVAAGHMAAAVAPSGAMRMTLCRARRAAVRWMETGQRPRSRDRSSHERRA